MILSTLTNELSIYVQAAINNSQVLVEDEENDTSIINVNNEEALPKESGITVYNDKNNNGWYYIIENGVKKTVYCYQHDKTQPSMDGTSGYSKVDFFSAEVNSPAGKVTKEMIATLLYLGFPSNINGLKETWKLDDAKANYFTQQAVWQLVRGNIYTNIINNSYQYDLHYYAGEPTSPYYGKYGYTGSVNLSGDTAFQKSGDTYKTGIININGDYTGSFSFDSLPSGIKIYNASTSQEVTGPLTVGMQIYFTYDGTITSDMQINLNYKYDTTEVFYLKASNSSNQDLVGLDVKNNSGTLTLTAKEDKKVSYTVVKKWNDSNNKDNLRPNSIKVQLKADDKAYGNLIELNESNNWTYTWGDLPEKSSQGTIKYSVEEIGNLTNYNVTYEDKDQTTVITNTETMDIPVTKKWVGNAGQSATIRLFADGVEVNSVELTKDNNWKHTFSGLAKYDQTTGNEINYSIKEDAVNGYDTVITGNAESGFTVTNTITGKTSVGVTKEWIGPKAASVTINLLADGKKVNTQVLNEKNNWQYTFTNLEKYKDGQEIKYTIEEVSIDGYKSVISGDIQNGFIITNTNTETMEDRKSVV